MLLVLLLQACDRKPDQRIQNGTHQYQHAGRDATCPQPPPGEHAGRWDDLTFASGLRYNLRGPANYDARVRHPLIVVFAGATHNAARSEQFTALTPAATARGYLIAYLQSRRLSARHLKRANEIVDSIVAGWCVDTNRIFFTGHSDGGTTTVAQTFLTELKWRPRAIAPSAAGFSAEALSEIDCGIPTPTMVLGMRDDELFPGYAASLAQWSARCHQCGSATNASDNGCQIYQSCSVSTVFCEVPGQHRQWPQKNREILDFFDQSHGDEHL